MKWQNGSECISLVTILCVQERRRFVRKSRGTKIEKYCIALLLLWSSTRRRRRLRSAMKDVQRTTLKTTCRFASGVHGCPSLLEFNAMPTGEQFTFQNNRVTSFISASRNNQDACLFYPRTEHCTSLAEKACVPRGMTRTATVFKTIKIKHRTSLNMDLKQTSPVSFLICRMTPYQLPAVHQGIDKWVIMNLIEPFDDGKWLTCCFYSENIFKIRNNHIFYFLKRRGHFALYLLPQSEYLHLFCHKKRYKHTHTHTHTHVAQYFF